MLMDELVSTTAEPLELLLLNQVAIRAALEELSLWVGHRGSVHIHENVMGALTALDTLDESISFRIERLLEWAIKQFRWWQADLSSAYDGLRERPTDSDRREFVDGLPTDMAEMGACQGGLIVQVEPGKLHSFQMLPNRNCKDAQ